MDQLVVAVLKRAGLPTTKCEWNHVESVDFFTPVHHTSELIICGTPETSPLGMALMDVV